MVLFSRLDRWRLPGYSRIRGVHPLAWLLPARALLHLCSAGLRRARYRRAEA